VRDENEFTICARADYSGAGLEVVGTAAAVAKAFCPRSAQIEAIQNGPMLPRIIEFRVSAEYRQITAARALERRNPAFDGITTGVIVGTDLYYVANPQTDKKIGIDWHPLQIFSVSLATR
jgi:hypothetical protein